MPTEAADGADDLLVHLKDNFLGDNSLAFVFYHYVISPLTACCEGRKLGGRRGITQRPEPSTGSSSIRFGHNQRLFQRRCTENRT